jgi:hypothetical protein
LVPGLRSLLEFTHPALGIAGLAFWLGFTLVHNQMLGWIAFGLAAATASAGLTWFTANARAARRASKAAAANRADHANHAAHASKTNYTNHANRVDHVNQADHANHAAHASKTNYTNHANRADHQNHTNHANCADHVNQTDQQNHASHPELFAGRLVVLHGAAAAITVMLAALAALAIVT